MALPASVRESRNLGVLAPFEGLHRRAGYAALDSVRGVITDPALHAQSGSDGWIPLALDTSRGAARAAQKLLATQRTSAIVGPLQPADAFAVLPVLTGEAQANAPLWIVPFARTADAFAPLDDARWLARLLEEAVAGVAAASASAIEQSAPFDRLVIAGSAPFSTITTKALAIAVFADPAMPVEIVDTPADVPEGALLLWLGNGDEGVRFVASLRQRLPQTVVWFPQWAADAVLQEHAAALDNWDWQGLYWSVWLPETMPAADAEMIDTATAQAILLRAATLAATNGVAGQPQADSWIMHTMPLLDSKASNQ